MARNYAEALLDLGKSADALEEYGSLLEAVAGAIQAEPEIYVVLESPRIRKEVKLGIIQRALRDIAPAPFVRFLQAVIRRGRQRLLGEMSTQYQALLDIQFNRVHAGVTLAREADRQLQKLITQRLSEALGQEVVAHFRTDPRVIGGMIVRVGDRVYDGSLRRKLRQLRRAMLQ